MKLLKGLVCVAVIALAGFVQADALYWQVDTEASTAYYKGKDVAYGAVYATQAGSYSEYADRQFVDMVAADSGSTIAPVLSDLGGYGNSSYSFFVELYNAQGEVVHTGYATSYNSLLNSGYISTSGVLAPTPLATGGYNGASVPEPTSGMLLLMGGALLALRRRRQ